MRKKTTGSKITLRLVVGILFALSTAHAYSASAGESMVLQDGDSKVVRIPAQTGEIVEIQAFLKANQIGGYTQTVQVFIDGEKRTVSLGRADKFEMSDGRMVPNYLDYKGGWTLPITPSLALFRYDAGIYSPADSEFQPSLLRFPIKHAASDGVEVRIDATFDGLRFTEVVVPSIRAVPPENSEETTR
jgi:hypothetical protein